MGRYKIADSPEGANLIMELRLDYGETPLCSTNETYGKPGPRSVRSRVSLGWC